MKKNQITLLAGLFLIAGSFCPLAGQASGELHDMRSFIDRFRADLGSLERTYPLRLSVSHQNRIKSYYQQWRLAMDELDIKGFSPEEAVDLTLFRNELDHSVKEIDLWIDRVREATPLIPFAGTIIGLEEKRRAMEPVGPEEAAGLLNAVTHEIRTVRDRLAAGVSKEKKESGVEPLIPTRTIAFRSAGFVGQLKEDLETWYQFYSGYDPSFTWWVKAPYKAADKALTEYASFLRETVVGIRGDDKDAIVGDPIGREALMESLRFEMIAYSPEELVQIAEKEYEWCEREMIRASTELGYGENWSEALEYVKTLHVAPGDQPELIRELAVEAVDFIEGKDLLTVPSLAKETWRMEMMSAERQKVSPFFTGGEVISVAFPLDSMQHEQKMMSLRGNNRHFARATVHHELIPGHHLQQFMTRRYSTHRQLFWTPFWVEGWALYWEMVLWENAFAKTPEDRIGMLFWRMHRCARIIFSLSFHLGTMTPEECIDFLVERVGHERDNATAEVRRSFGGSYPPLYQAAYMLGALQFRELEREVVGSGTMTAREFRNRVLREGTMPVEMLRLLLTGQSPEGSAPASWRFYPGLD